MALSSLDVYPNYYQTYLSKVYDPDLLMAMLKNKESTINLFGSIPSEKGDFKYAIGKWTVKEVFQHIMDTERVMVYRALRFCRGDKTELPGFDQDIFALEYALDGINIDQMIEEFTAIRNSSILFFRHITKDQLHYQGIASGWPITVNALLHVVVGHAEHHNQILKERYL